MDEQEPRKFCNEQLPPPPSSCFAYSLIKISTDLEQIKRLTQFKKYGFINCKKSMTVPSYRRADGN